MNNQNRQPPPPYNQHNPANQYNLQHNIPNRHSNQHINPNQHNLPRYPQHHQQRPPPLHHQQRPPQQMQRYILPQGNAPMYYNQPVYFYNQSFNPFPGQQLMQMNGPYRPPIINNALPPVPIVNNPPISVNPPSAVNGVATSVMAILNDKSNNVAKDKSADQSRKDDENSNDESEESNRKRRKKKR